MDEQELRKEIVDGVRRAVIKVGSSLLVSLGAGLNKAFISRLAGELCLCAHAGPAVRRQRGPQQRLRRLQRDRAVW